MSPNPETVIDGFFGLEGGMNSVLSPHLIADNEYHVGFNVTARSGQVGTRPGFRYFSPAATDYRGGIVYRHSNGSFSFLYVDGTRVEVIDLSTGANDTTPTAITSATFAEASEAYFCIVGMYVVVQNGKNRPRVLQAPTTSSGTWTVSSSLAANIPIGTHMAFGHGRLFICVPSGATKPVIKVAMSPVAPVCTVLNGGGGYNDEESATFTHSSVINYKVFPYLTFPTGSGLTDRASNNYSVVVKDGVVTSVTINETFSILPDVTIRTNNEAGVEDSTGASGDGAVVEARLKNTTVQSVSVTSAGSGYTLTPRIRFDNTGTGGSGAAVTTSSTGPGNLTVTLTNGGVGYNAPPRVIIEDCGGPEQEIVASDITYGGSTEFYDVESSGRIPDIGTVLYLNVEAPFTEGEAITLENHSSVPDINGNWAAVRVGEVPRTSRGIASIKVVDEGTGYKSAPTITVEAPPADNKGRRAKAVVKMQSTIDTIKVSDRGSGYTNANGAKVELRDLWSTAGITGFDAPDFKVVLGKGKSVDKVDKDKVKEVTVVDGGGPYPGKKKARVRNWSKTTGTWVNGTRKTLAVPPEIIILDKNGSTSSGVVAVNTGTTANPKYSYPSGKKHAKLKAVMASVVDSVSITDSGTGYVDTPSVTVSGGKPREAARFRAVLESSTSRNPKAVLIPALLATNGRGGRIRRAVAGKFEDVFNFTETIYLAEGGGFNVSGTAGRVTGMFFLPVADSTSGRGDLVVLGNRGAVTLGVSNMRADWKQIPFVRVLLTETGAVADKAFTISQGDVFFYSSEGLRSYRQARASEADGSVMPLDTQLFGVLGPTKQSSSRLAYFDNRLFFTASRTSASSSDYRALGVLDFASSSSGLGRASNAAWDGLWFAPGQDPGTNAAGVTTYFKDIHSTEKTLLAVCSNGIFVLDTSLQGDRLTTATTITDVKWVLETRAIDFKNPTVLKRLLRASVWVQDARGTNKHSFLWRTENRPNWNTWVSNQTYTSSNTDYAYRVDIPMLPGDMLTAATDAEMDVGLDRGQNFQFRWEGEGRFRLIRFLFYSVPTVESQYGVVQSSTVTIIPTGSAEPYPL
jgi:hypothetical protein